MTAFINTACLLPEEMGSTFLVWNTKKEQHQICWQCHGRIFPSPGSGGGVSAHPEDPLTPSRITGILIISDGLWWGEDEILRYQLKKINNKRKSLCFWALCAQCLLLPASVQQCPGHRPLLPWSHSPLGTPGAIATPGELLPSLCAPWGPHTEGLKIKTNGRLRTFYNHKLSSCVALAEGCVVRT